jgi:hypothetical protein
VVLPSLRFTVPAWWCCSLLGSPVLQNCGASAFRVHCSSKIVVFPSLGCTVSPKLWFFGLQCSLFLQNCGSSVFSVHCSSKIVVLPSSELTVPPKVWCFRLQGSLCIHNCTNDLSDCMTSHPLSPKSSKTNKVTVCRGICVILISSRVIVSGKQIWPRLHVIYFNIYTRELPCYQWKEEGNRVT